MKLTTHISFPGTCEEAFRFYHRCFGGEIVTMLTWGDSPIANLVEPDWYPKICHATLRLGPFSLAGNDTPPHQYERPAGFRMLLSLDSIAQAEHVFAALAEGGKVILALHTVFWAERYGILVDSFGVQWKIQSTEAPQP